MKPIHNRKRSEHPVINKAQAMCAQLEILQADFKTYAEVVKKQYIELRQLLDQFEEEISEGMKDEIRATEDGG